MNCKRFSVVFRILLPVILVLLTTSLVCGQPIYFQTDHIVFINEQLKPIILISLFVTYNQLNFQIEESLYRAEVDISAILYTGKEQKGGDIWKKEITVHEFEETNSNTNGIFWVFELPSSPGKYDLQVGIKDLNTKREGKRIEKVTIEDIGETSIWISRPGFLLGSEGIKKGMLIAENLNVGIDSLFTIVEIVSDSLQEEGVLLRYKVVDTNEDEVCKINNYIELDSTIIWKNFLFPIGDLKEEAYTVSVEIVKEGKTLAKSSKGIYVSYPFFMSKRYIERVEQMEYIATEKEMKELKRPSPEEREKAWNNFWSKKDPIPETPLNETSEEYFARVDYANEHFKSFQSGWRTDRGRIYIIYGQPDDIEYHPFELGSPPYQIWYYFSLGRRFVFADLSMTGDYIQVRE